jgi:hypothetical protein
VKTLDYNSPTTSRAVKWWRPYKPWLVIAICHLIGSGWIFVRCYVFWDDDPHAVRDAICVVYELPMSAIARLIPAVNSAGGFAALALINALIWSLCVGFLWESVAHLGRR